MQERHLSEDFFLKAFFLKKKIRPPGVPCWGKMLLNKAEPKVVLSQGWPLAVWDSLQNFKSFPPKRGASAAPSTCSPGSSALQPSSLTCCGKQDSMKAGQQVTEKWWNREKRWPEKTLASSLRGSQGRKWQPSFVMYNHTLKGRGAEETPWGYQKLWAQLWTLLSARRS